MAAERSAVLLDWGGVMTGDLFGSFRASAPPRASTPTSWPTSSATTATPARCSSTSNAGASRRPTSSPGSRPRSDWPGTRGSSTACSRPRPRRRDGRGRARPARPRRRHRPGLQLLGHASLPARLLAELFDGIVISGEEGFRKPDPRMYELGAQRIGAEPGACVFVDDLVFNLDPARELGMAAVHHRRPRGRSPSSTVGGLGASAELRGAEHITEGRESPAARAGPLLRRGPVAQRGEVVVLRRPRTRALVAGEGDVERSASLRRPAAWKHASW